MHLKGIWFALGIALLAIQGLPGSAQAQERDPAPEPENVGSIFAVGVPLPSFQWEALAGALPEDQIGFSTRTAEVLTHPPVGKGIEGPVTRAVMVPSFPVIDESGIGRVPPDCGVRPGMVFNAQTNVRCSGAFHDGLCGPSTSCAKHRDPHRVDRYRGSEDR